jgi:hypothetical protein
LNYQREFEVLLLFCGYGVCLFFGWLAFILLLKISRNEIDLSKLLSEANGDASMSRFQLLVFTMIVAFSFFIIVIKTWTLPSISDGILTMLGISASTFAVSKGIQFSRPETLIRPEDRQHALDAAQEMSNTGASVVMTPGSVISGGTPPPEQTPASPQ